MDLRAYHLRIGQEVADLTSMLAGRDPSEPHSTDITNALEHLYWLFVVELEIVEDELYRRKT